MAVIMGIVEFVPKDNNLDNDLDNDLDDEFPNLNIYEKMQILLIESKYNNQYSFIMSYPSDVNKESNGIPIPNNKTR